MSYLLKLKILLCVRVPLYIYNVNIYEDVAHAHYLEQSELTPCSMALRLFSWNTDFAGISVSSLPPTPSPLTAPNLWGVPEICNKCVCQPSWFPMDGSRSLRSKLVNRNLFS